jgi:hypothetical protein
VQRTQLEKELGEAQARAAAAERRAERTEMQLMEYRNLQNASGLAMPDSESDEGDTGGSEFQSCRNYSAFVQMPLERKCAN